VDKENTKFRAGISYNATGMISDLRHSWGKPRL